MACCAYWSSKSALNLESINPKSAKFPEIHLEMGWWISDSDCSTKPLWSGMGEVVPARTSPTLHPPFPPTLL